MSAAWPDYFLLQLLECVLTRPCYAAHVEGRRQLSGVNSLFPPCGFQGLSQGQQAWWPAPFCSAGIQATVLMLAQQALVTTSPAQGGEIWMFIIYMSVFPES